MNFFFLGHILKLAQNTHFDILLSKTCILLQKNEGKKEKKNTIQHFSTQKNLSGVALSQPGTLFTDVMKHHYI